MGVDIKVWLDIFIRDIAGLQNLNTTFFHCQQSFTDSRKNYPPFSPLCLTTQIPQIISYLFFCRFHYLTAFCTSSEKVILYSGHFLLYFIISLIYSLFPFFPPSFPFSFSSLLFFDFSSLIILLLLNFFFLNFFHFSYILLIHSFSPHLLLLILLLFSTFVKAQIFTRCSNITPAQLW